MPALLSNEIFCSHCKISSQCLFLFSLKEINACVFFQQSYEPAFEEINLLFLVHSSFQYKPDYSLMFIFSFPSPLAASCGALVCIHQQEGPCRKCAPFLFVPQVQRAICPATLFCLCQLGSRLLNFHDYWPVATSHAEMPTLSQSKNDFPNPCCSVHSLWKTYLEDLKFP